MMYLVFLWCIVLVSADDQSCRLISNKPHGELNIYGNGLHRQIELTAAIQAKTRVPQCRLVYKVMIPERAYVDEREMQSSNPGYDFVVLFSKSSNIQIVSSYYVKLYIVKKKLYLSTFEIKDTVSWKVHLQPPSNLYPRTLTFKTPNVAVDCNGEFANCIALKMHNGMFFLMNQKIFEILRMRFNRKRFTRNVFI
ncbi:Protein CBG04129 [Caenorhabditis briggsae]|uniref:Protein CBG04129 n=1 Tax=Caenorhabditis briggsae TaxID=6238 RepID=A8WVM3_CAEBR|nr:Protein CBG04129 [Caenorhabditis briggsae]CAP24534.2 Protein CBG04129 [Caenorhabditis briggsae]